MLLNLSQMLMSQLDARQTMCLLSSVGLSSFSSKVVPAAGQQHSNLHMAVILLHDVERAWLCLARGHNSLPFHQVAWEPGLCRPSVGC